MMLQYLQKRLLTVRAYVLMKDVPDRDMQNAFFYLCLKINS